MRLFLAALTVGAAGIGYALIQHSELHSAEVDSPTRSLFDWDSAADPVRVAMDIGAGNPPDTVRDTINKTRTEIVSTLDDFVRDNAVSNNVVPDPTPSAADDIVASDDVVVQTQHSEIVEPNIPDPVIPVSKPIDTPVDLGPRQPQVNNLDAAERTSAPPFADEVASSLTPTTPSDRTQPTTTPISEVALKGKKPAATKPPADNGSGDDSSQTVRNKSDLPPATTRDRDKRVSDSGWTSVGKTAKDLPIHTRHFGSEGARTMVIAGIDGRDSVAVGWIDNLASALPGQTDLFPENEIQVFRAGNPDGLVKTTATNARGVLINRNFPSRRYQLLPDRSTGLGPVSEAETKAILDVLYTFRPRRVVHLMSTHGKSKAIYNRSAKETALELEKEHKLEIQPLDVELVPGSLEDFSDGTLDASVITLQLSIGADWQKAWKTHQPTVITAINGRNPADSKTSSDDVARMNEGMRIPTSGTVLSPTQKIRRGYEELPPPPR